jgi:hypothetical protein
LNQTAAIQYLAIYKVTLAVLSHVIFHIGGRLSEPLHVMRGNLQYAYLSSVTNQLGNTLHETELFDGKTAATFSSSRITLPSQLDIAVSERIELRSLPNWRI